MLPPEDFAATYDPPGYDDSFDIVRDYYAVLGFDDRKDAGPTRAARLIGVTRYRSSNWLDDVVPDAVRGTEFAEEHGWLNSDPNSRPGQELAVLTMAAFVCGSIAKDTYRPRWGPQDTTVESLVWKAINTVGLEARRGNPGDYRPAEISVSDGGAKLGRALVAIGAPRGEKTAETVPPLPSAFLEADEETRETLAQMFISERGTHHDGKATVTLQLRERSPEYRESVAALLRSVTDEEISIGETSVGVSADAARDLDVVA